MDRRRIMKRLIKLVIPELIRELEKELKNDKKRIWTRQWLMQKQRGTANTLLEESEIEDTKEYRLSLRMDLEQFNSILTNVSPIIGRADTVMRSSIPAKTKLQITLMYLATGNSFRSLQSLFGVSVSAISRFIPEVLDAIYNYLKDYIKVPANHEEWKMMEIGFKTRWNLPGCYGAIDGKHVGIQAPAYCGHEFWNYKGASSIVLLAIVDHDYCFRCINVEVNGRNSDGSIFRNCSIYQSLENGMLPEGGFLVGDAAFPLKPYLLTPYTCKPLTKEQQTFNYRVSRAHRIVENAFGILASRFKIFQKPISVNIDVTSKIVRTACALHNWLRVTGSDTYLQSDTVDKENINTGEVIEGTWRKEMSLIMPSINNIGENSVSSARELREKYTDYFSKEGAVPWQNRMID